MSVTLGLMLSSGIRVLHQRKRALLAKQIVELDDDRYIVVRFPKRAVFERYVSLLEKMSDAGVSSSTDHRPDYHSGANTALWALCDPGLCPG